MSSPGLAVVKTHIKSISFPCQDTESYTNCSQLYCAVAAPRKKTQQFYLRGLYLERAKNPQLTQMTRTEKVKTGPQKGMPSFQKPCLEIRTRETLSLTCPGAMSKLNCELQISQF